MNKNIIKITLITTIMFFGAFFTNIDSAKADNNNRSTCECYYYGESLDGSVKTKYDVVMRYGPYSADVVSLCQNADHLVGGQANIYQNCQKIDNATRGNPFNVDSAYIAKEKCSVKACDSAKIYFWSHAISDNTTFASVSHEIVTRGYNEPWGFVSAPLTAYDKKTHDAIVSADSMTEAWKDHDLTGVQAIIDWGENEIKKGDLEWKDSDGCEHLLSNYKIREFLNNLFWIISIIGIILLIVMTAMEFIKVITGQDDEGIKKAFKHTIIRIVCVVILLLLPMIINTIITIINENNKYYLTDKNGEIVKDEKGNPIELKLTIGDDKQPTCGIGEVNE